MEKKKKVVQRNLPLDAKYTIIGSYYSSIEETGTCCENCGRPISDCCDIVNERGNKHTVGMDCASTLSGIKDTLNFSQHEYNFSLAKQARAKIMKAIKQHGIEDMEISASTFENADNYWKEIGAGNWRVWKNAEGRNVVSNWQSYPKDRWQNYVLPMIKDLINK
jgi:hypothetical protein